jgi:hypothetical protein
MPQPRISIQSVPSPNFTIGPERSHWMSTSNEGSVNGKKEGRKRMVTIVDLEEGLAELLQHPAQMADIGGLVDHQAFDLMEHRRVGRVGILPVGLARNDDADRRCLGFHGADLHRRGMGAQHLALAVSSGSKKKVSCISRAGWPSGKLSAVKL